MTAVIAWQVFGRYVLNDSPAWAESLALVSMLYIVWTGAAVGVHEQFHLGIRLVVSHLPIRVARVVYIFGQLLIAFFGVAMAISGVRLVSYTSSHVMPTLEVSRAIAYVPFIFSGLLITLFAAACCLMALNARSGEELWR